MTFRNIYGTFRDWNIKTLDLKDISLNGGYNIEFFNKGQFLDYELAGITKLSTPISLDKYTGKIPVIDENEQPTGEFLPKLTRFVQLQYSDLYTNNIDLTASIEKSGANMNVQMFNTIEEARAWIRNNTSLIEVSDGKFKLTDESTGMDGQIIEATYLEII